MLQSKSFWHINALTVTGLWNTTHVNVEIEDDCFWIWTSNDDDDGSWLHNTLAVDFSSTTKMKNMCDVVVDTKLIKATQDQPDMLIDHTRAQKIADTCLFRRIMSQYS